MNIKVGDVVLNTVKKAKRLGVTIDESLTWSDHIDFLSKKLAQKIGILRRLRVFMSNAALLKIYNTVIFSHFYFCCTVWCSAKNNGQIEKKFKFQKRAARYILNVKTTQTSTVDFF